MGGVSQWRPRRSGGCDDAGAAAVEHTADARDCRVPPTVSDQPDMTRTWLQAFAQRQTVPRGAVNGRRMHFAPL
jgi:hypothetical protein